MEKSQRRISTILGVYEGKDGRSDKEHKDPLG